MAVVTKYGKGYPNSALLYRANVQWSDPKLHKLLASIAVANGDSANSKLYFGKVPTGAFILPSSIVYHTGITSLTDLDIGLAYKTTDDPDILADGLDVSSAGTKSLIASVGTADLGKPVYELLGLANDPGGMADLYATLKAAAGAAGTIFVEADYATRT